MCSLLVCGFVTEITYTCALQIIHAEQHVTLNEKLEGIDEWVCVLFFSPSLEEILVVTITTLARSHLV